MAYFPIGAQRDPLWRLWKKKRKMKTRKKNRFRCEALSHGELFALLYYSCVGSRVCSNCKERDRRDFSFVEWKLWPNSPYLGANQPTNMANDDEELFCRLVANLALVRMKVFFSPKSS